MANLEHDLPPPLQLASRYAPKELRKHYTLMFALDRDLGRISVRTDQTIARQLRLAWWRQELLRAEEGAPAASPLLQDLRTLWGRKAPALALFADGWEAMMLADGLVNELDHGMADRARAAASLTLLTDERAYFEQVRSAYRIYAWAEYLALQPSDDRARLIAAFPIVEAGQPNSLPIALRPFAVLAALGRRSLSKGGRPLLEGRLAAATVMRAGLIGR